MGGRYGLSPTELAKLESQKTFNSRKAAIKCGAIAIMDKHRVDPNRIVEIAEEIAEMAMKKFND